MVSSALASGAAELRLNLKLITISYFWVSLVSTNNPESGTYSYIASLYVFSWCFGPTYTSENGTEGTKRVHEATRMASNQLTRPNVFLIRFHHYDMDPDVLAWPTWSEVMLTVLCSSPLHLIAKHTFKWALRVKWSNVRPASTQISWLHHAMSSNF